MGKLFGTDGIRGIANENLTCELAYRVGQALAISLAEEKKQQPTVVIGKDTRISGDMLEHALLAGLCASGANAIRLGVIPTPAVAYLTLAYGADSGIVISASHNPFQYNGIKIFSGEGFKLSDELEARVEELILAEGSLPCKQGGEIGRVREAEDGRKRYLDHLLSTVSEISGLRVLVDCANGASSATAGELFAALDLEADLIHHEPDGVNINDHCGSTHLEDLAKRVVAGGYDLGIAFDGDADRCLAVDEKGSEVDGDKIMAICAEALTRQGRLQGGGFVATVMSNLGLHKYCREKNLKLLCANVGDRNVLELMQREGMVLGGEQSGHIIFLEHMSTGDGQLAALQFLQILCRSGKKLSELCSAIGRYPQILRNVAAPLDKAAKEALLERPELQASIREGEKLLAGDGRILVRPSGTEALIRVMVEASRQELAQQVVDMVSDTVEKLQK